MVEFGYALSSEEHPPSRLVEMASQAEEAGFSFALISDHYHPWIDLQGQSGFVWAVIGGIAASTRSLRLGTGVTCPTIRIHPAIIAQAAATAAQMMAGRFFLGLGSGENLNEHVFGDKWPPVATRQGMLVEAIEIMRELWQGKLTSFEGQYYTVENARIYSLPEEPPPIYVAASGPEAARIAGKVADGLIGTSLDEELLKEFQSTGNDGPRYGQLTVCWAPGVEEGRRTAHKWWPTAALNGTFPLDLALPAYFEEAAANVREEDIAKQNNLRAGRRGAHQGDRQRRGGGLRPRLHPPGWPRAGRLLPLLRTRSVACSPGRVWKGGGGQ
jgi:G6PDH family F420-dependent oxidoreductase